MTPSEITTRTFRWEAMRAASSGILETAFLTFALLIAIEAFESGNTTKAFLLASGPLGLIATLFVVPLMRRLNKSVTRMAMEINLVGAFGYFLAATLSESIWAYCIGLSLGFVCSSLQIPLHTHWLRSNYPTKDRGRLFGAASFVRAISSMSFGLIGGWMLERNFASYPAIIAIFGCCMLFSAFAISRLPVPSMAPASSPGVFQAMKWIRIDRKFRWVLISAMAMGFGVLTSSALRVDYAANPEFGLEFSETRVALLTSTLPALMRIITTFFWGMMFDRINFIILRIVLNVFFGLSLFLYFWTDVFWVIAIGAALAGIARGGGEIVWNLWVTKLAPEDHTADYMSVHT
ncbi:MAG: MFS transporter, partial [Verrucomicrobiota bacterium]